MAPGFDDPMLSPDLLPLPGAPMPPRGGGGPMMMDPDMGMHPMDRHLSGPPPFHHPGNRGPPPSFARPSNAGPPPPPPRGAHLCVLGCDRMSDAGLANETSTFSKI
eukprot:218321-Pelagomonas_calceolata.AAC.1